MHAHDLKIGHSQGMISQGIKTKNSQMERNENTNLGKCLIVHYILTWPIVGLQIGSHLLHKGGDIDYINDYQTIIVDFLMTKLFGCVMEAKLSG